MPCKYQTIKRPKLFRLKIGVCVRVSVYVCFHKRLLIYSFHFARTSSCALVQVPYSFCVFLVNSQQIFPKKIEENSSKQTS